MADRNGHGAQMVMVPLTALIPAGMTHVEITQVTARWRSPGGIQLGSRPVPFRVGVPDAFALKMVCAIAQAGRLRVVTGHDDEAQPISEAVPADVTFVLLPVQPRIVPP